MLVTHEEAVHRSLAPFAMSEALSRAFVTGEWPSATVELVDPRDTPPWRVRAGAICLDDHDRVAVIRGDDHRGLFFELAGGGVEAGPPTTPRSCCPSGCAGPTGVALLATRGAT